MIRVVLPAPLRAIADAPAELLLEPATPICQRTVIDAVENRYPMLRGTIRDHATGNRRAYVRFFAAAQDLSHQSAEAPLPEVVADGTEPFLIVGATAGG